MYRWRQGTCDLIRSDVITLLIQFIGDNGIKLKKYSSQSLTFLNFCLLVSLTMILLIISHFEYERPSWSY